MLNVKLNIKILGFKRFPLRVVESNPKIAKAELIENNSKIKITAFAKGDTNIIVFHPKNRKIFDVIKISVYSSINLPGKLTLNIGGSVALLDKDESRKLYMMQDSEWVTDNNQILKVDPYSGVITGLREGTTHVHLITKDQKKIKLSTVVQVSEIRKIKIDFDKLPKYLTDIRGSQQYREEYT